jgi:hypothetical protein
MRDPPDWYIYLALFFLATVVSGPVLVWCGVVRGVAFWFSLAAGAAAVAAWWLFDLKNERDWRRSIERHQAHQGEHRDEDP